MQPACLSARQDKSPLALRLSALSVLVEVEKWNGPAPGVRAYEPPLPAADAATG